MARRGLAGMGAAGFSGAAGVAVTWLVARALGAEQAGAFFAATAGFVLAGGVVRLGTQTGLVYWVAWLRMRERTHLLGACLRIALVPVAAASVAVAAVLWFAAPAPLDSLALFLPLAALSDAALAGTRGYRQLRPTLLLERLARPALQVLTIGTLAVAAVSTPGPYAAAWVVPYLPAALLAGYALRRAYLSVPTPRAGRATRRISRCARGSGGTPGHARWPASPSSPSSGWTCCWWRCSAASRRPPCMRSPAASSCSDSSPTRASRRACSHGWPRHCPQGTGSPPTTCTRPRPAGSCWSPGRST
ncbi:hypothetical protein Psuf_042170 [Phytohabitans suffuscus]|uniref:Polysaccharide biosynthesis protein C-terminal domain-containing protein n=1 Tax=Phytohabitans suffuscus TaxID=624315 RepID=A0A6F8YLB1_9ACTN|nr:hypothetical protein Psuf_042170 [Phytohabitans suffuscus]